MTYPLVSIIIPVYNVEDYIFNCIKSIFAIDYPNIEIIVVDDKTPDNSIDIVRSYALENARSNITLKILNHEVNKGLTAAREYGFKASTGKYLMFVDSDDYLVNQHYFKKIVEEAELYQADIVVFGYQCDHGNNRKTIPINLIYSDPQQYFFQIINRKAPCNIWGKFIRRDLFGSSSIIFDHDIGMGEDFAIYPKLVFNAKTIFNRNKDILYNYNCSNKNSYTSIGLSEKGLKSLMKAITIIYDFMMDKGIEQNALHKFININRIILLEMSDTKYWKDISKYQPEHSLTSYGLPLKHRLFYYIYKTGLYKLARLISQAR